MVEIIPKPELASVPKNAIAVLLILVFLPVTASAQLREKTPEELKKERQWEICYERTQKETGAKACYTYCSRGINEHNIGSKEIKDLLSDCQQQQNCHYFDFLARNECDWKIHNMGADDEYKEKFRQRRNIKPGIESWLPSH